MPFKIEITEIIEVETKESKWMLLEKRPLTDKEALDTYEDARTQQKEVYGYGPEVSKTEAKSKQVYCSTVNTLDLGAVIKAVHKL